MAASDPAHRANAHAPVFAVGASAGGIAALQKLVARLPAHLPFALVVLQHLPPDRESRLADLIAKWTRIPVYRTTDGMQPEIDCIYVPSSGSILTLEEGLFRTRPVEGGCRRPGIDTIDAFLESLALHPARPAVGVVLSGTGMDGAAGAVCLRQAGGIVIIQDPLTAMYDGMPTAILHRGLHDHVLPVSAIAQQLVACADPAYVRPVRSTGWTSPAAASLGRVVQHIQQQVGFDLSGYKPSPLLWRIQQRMDTRKVWSFEDYASLIEDDPVELESLMRGIPIHVTEFFRDGQAWTVLLDDVLLPLVDDYAGQEPIRVWTSACSSGEEAYSVAMLLDEAARERGKAVNFQVFGTDAAPELVARASRGIFSESALAGLSDERRARYFYRTDGAYRVKRALRQKIVFAPHDLLADPPFADLDLVTCRNLLIYLKPETARDVLHALHRALRTGGCLFLGRSEPYPLDQQDFLAVSRLWNIHRKIRAAPDARESAPPRKRPAAAGAANLAVLRTAQEQANIPSVLIDDECTVLRIYGNTETILKLPAGEPTLKLTDLVPRQWSAHLRLSVRDALNERKPLVLTQLFDRATGDTSMAVRLTPLDTPADARCMRILVSFIRDPDAPDTLAGRDMHADLTGDAALDVDASEQANISREELEASREELQALNEELSASNDELSRSNDDLNEANTRLQDHVVQLAMQSRVLLAGSIMTIFLDRELKVRWFTPSMRDVLPLAPADIGRSIADLVPKFSDLNFYTDIATVLDSGAARHAIVANDEGRSFLRKTFPYVSETGAVAGVAITFADITDRTRAEVALRRNQAWLSAQKEAFQSAMNGRPLDSSLGILIRSLVSQADDKRRCAFYIAEGDVLNHVVGMSDAYARCVAGFRISTESLACGLAVATGRPVVTRDVLDEPRWRAWTWLAKRFGYRGCWSFPVETSEGTLVGSLAMYFEEPRMPSELDIELAAAFTHTAGIIIWRHLQMQDTQPLH
ncbi:CheR family methyltransferase [Paraburkholderia sp. SIMBA_009]|uniref:Two-component system, chemotaxis family, CheB/CheR fusion protein n=1 Tax=Paraburkholderia tropica TaxID=92647 RepID=A0AAQ1JY47_9BURK|nr:CheR family methyltransferase [Paraburkholderia tropica]RQN34348.1 GAF domain-containing protein [Paraburkholderia tropica]SEK14237.1 two-component system, chemotaxis family, CheB/CheR fusion protein [Paraburkholderia tropica]